MNAEQQVPATVMACFRSRYIRVCRDRAYFMITLIFTGCAFVILSSFNSAVKDHNEGWKRLAEIANMEPSHKDANLLSFAKVLAKYSSEDKWITLAMADEGCVDMAINFYHVSLAKFKISNYIIIGIDRRTCDSLTQNGINCYVYVSDEDAGHASVYHTKDFLRKMNIRTYFILDALRLGYSVVHTDVDIYFMKNPFEDFDYNSPNYDIAPMTYKTDSNAGFLFIRNSKASIAVYADSCHIANTEPKTDDQLALNRAINSVKERMEVSLLPLSKEKYESGIIYWDQGGRNFADKQRCDECVVVHNNWIVSMEAKRYRFREMHMWVYDGNGYYSDPKAKYLTFNTQVIPGETTVEEEIDALKAAMAIGEILNRTVILPTFHCSTGECTILDYLLLRKFEEVFQYREHTFPNHPLVPESVKQSSSDIMVIAVDKLASVKTPDIKDTKTEVFKPKDSAKGATSDEISQWFGSKQQSILNFGSLSGTFCCFTDPKKQTEFSSKIEKGFVKGKYKQM